MTRRFCDVIVFCLALQGLPTLPLIAEEQENTEEDIQRIEIKAAGETPGAAAPSVPVTVITKEEIQRAAPRGLAQLLAPSLGVQILRYGAPSQGAYISIRGASPEQVVILIDGVPANSAQGGGVDLSSISLEDVERIEIYRGGNSSLFGENALGGAVNIITQKASRKDLHSETYVSLGSFQSAAAGTTLSGSPGRAFDYSVHLGALYSGGAYGYESAHSGSDAVRENADAAGLNASARISLHPLTHLEMTAGIAGGIDERGAPGIIEFPTPGARIRDKKLSLSAALDYQPEGLRIWARAGWGYANRQYKDADYFLGPVDDTHENTLFRAGAGATRVIKTGALTVEPALGWDYRLDMLESTALVDDEGITEGDGFARRHQHSFAAQLKVLPAGDTLFIPRLYPSLRLDLNSIEGGNSQRLDTPLSWAIGTTVPLLRNQLLSLKGNLTRSHRVPSFNDLFWPSTAFALGNPSLRMETGYMWDAGFEARPAPWLSVSATYYRHRIEDLILWTPGAGGRWRPGNIGQALIQGAETDVRVLFDVPSMGSTVESGANAGWMLPEDTTPGSATRGKLLPRRAQFVLNTQATITRYEGHSLKIETQYVSPRYQNQANTKTINGYFLVNASAIFRLGSRGSVILSGQNVLNVRFVDLHEYPVPGVSFNLETRLEL